MENLIDFSYRPPMLHYPIRLFGVIKHKCFAIDVTGSDSSSENLHPGCLIQLINDYHDECYFKMRNFTNWLDKYKTTIYKCSKEDYITVNMELWPYLVACKIENRIKFVQNVYSHKFDLNQLKLGSELKILGSLNDIKYEFIVMHNDVVKEMGPGYYLGLQLKNKTALSSNLKGFTQYYRFGGTGIIVSADWIMDNLYKEEDYFVTKIYPIKRNALCKSENYKYGNKSVGNKPENIWEFGSKELLPDVSENVRRLSIASVEPTNINENRAMSNFLCCSPETSTNIKSNNCITELELFNNVVGSVKNSEITKCDLCAALIEIGCGVILRECVHSFCMPCIQSHVALNSKLSNTIQCPYDKEYKCQYNMLSIEIIDLSDDSYYNRFVKDHLKHYMSDTEVIARNSLYKQPNIQRNINKFVADQCPFVKDYMDCKYSIEDSMALHEIMESTLSTSSCTDGSMVDRAAEHQMFMEDQLDCNKTGFHLAKTCFCFFCESVFNSSTRNVFICPCCSTMGSVTMI